MSCLVHFHRLVDKQHRPGSAGCLNMRWPGFPLFIEDMSYFDSAGRGFATGRKTKTGFSLYIRLFF